MIYRVKRFLPPFAIPGCAGWMGLVVAILVPLVLCLLILTRFELANMSFTGLGVDWAHHMTLVESYLLDGGRDHSPGNLGEMQYYPPASHILVARLSSWLQLSPVITFQGISVVTVLLGSAFVSLLVAVRGLKCTLPIVALLCCLAFIGVTNYIGLGLNSLVTFNGFFARLVGMSLVAAIETSTITLLRGVRTIIPALGGEKMTREQGETSRANGTPKGRRNNLHTVNHRPNCAELRFVSGLAA